MASSSQILVRRLSRSHLQQLDPHQLLRTEWLLTNGLGGYASGTIMGSMTRRFHAWLVAALPVPFGRVVMLNHLSEHLHLPDGRIILLSGEETEESRSSLASAQYLAEFRLENQLPVWRYEAPGVVMEKRLILLHQQNTAQIFYQLLAGPDDLRLELRPALHFRPHEQPVNAPIDQPYATTIVEDRIEIAAGSGVTPLRLRLLGEESVLTLGRRTIEQWFYSREAERGYESSGPLWSPGHFSVRLRPGAKAVLVASTESWEVLAALDPDEAYAAEAERRVRLIEAAEPKAREGLAAELVLAADQFIITPAGRIEDSARARAAGEEVRTVIAGYHWFTDWGRDTMISLVGLTLSTGRAMEAGWILRTFAHYIRAGLIPNLFPEGESRGLYHTADATLWFFHALDCYLAATGDRETLRVILPRLQEVAEFHRKGTRFGIGLDPADGLLRQGAEGYQLTWMDAKVDDWVVTPRRGKAVEINALWYNALCLLAGWLREAGDEGAAQKWNQYAEQARASFNRRFWHKAGGYLYDVVDGEKGDDARCRPNQILAFSLRHEILERERWERVLEVVRERLLTPVGLRTLSRDDPDYKAQYFGNLRSRDAAYHQGTVWAWLIGPFIDAWLKVRPEDRAGARRCLEGFAAHLDEGCVGSISEIFDAEPPFTPRGCIAQAWSVAEVLRSWIKTAD